MVCDRDVIVNPNAISEHHGGPPSPPSFCF